MRVCHGVPNLKPADLESGNFYHLLRDRYRITTRLQLDATSG
jgi:hypothetical protein